MNKLNFLNPKKENINTEEYGYLQMLTKILREGNIRNTRSGETLSLFGTHMSFSLANNKIPLLTTKKVFFRGIVEELLWFVNSRTDSKELENKKVNIWRGNTTRKFLDCLGLDYNEGTCGPVYGFQWRHFKDTYKGSNEDYTGKGFDQLQECIRLIKENPTSRRIFMSAWNPLQLKEMCLPCCHVSYQWYVQNNKLSCQMYQRSGDMFLGVPFNIVSTSLLTIMIAHITGLQPGNVSFCIGDAHIYKDHLEQVCKQLSRTPYSFPTLNINRKVDNIEDFKFEDFTLNDYKNYGILRAKMNV